MILLNCITVSCIILGMYVACNWQGMIFTDICTWMYFHIPAVIYKPLCGCPYCMASIWTLVYCYFTNDMNFLILIKIPCTCGTTAILMHILNTAYPEHKP